MLRHDGDCVRVQDAAKPWEVAWYGGIAGAAAGMELNKVLSAPGEEGWWLWSRVGVIGL